MLSPVVSVSARPSGRRGEAAALIGATVLLLLSGRLGLYLATLHGNVSAVWPVTGVAIWMMLTFGLSRWPIVAGAVLLIEFYFANIGLPTSAALAAGSTMEAVAGAWLWRKVRQRWPGELRELAGCLAASLVAPLASATVGTVVLSSQMPVVVGELWITWWTGDAVGALSVLPVLLAGPELWVKVRSGTRREAGRAAAVLAAAAAVGWLAFGLAGGGAFLFSVFPVLLLAMVWFGAPGARLVALLIAAAGITGEFAGRGLFGGADANGSLLSLQIFLASVTVAALVLPLFRTRGSMLLPVGVLLIGWTMSGWIFAVLQRDGLKREEQLFTDRVAVAEAAIRVRATSYVDALLGGASFFAASKTVERGDWRAYADSLRLSVRYPGINGIGVIFPVRPDEEVVWLAARRADGAPDLAIKPFPATTAVPDDIRYVITFIEPVVLNRASLGRNVATEPSRRAALEQARDTGEPRMNRRIPGSRDAERRSGFLLYVPLYRRGASTGSVAERRAAHIGWVHAQFFADNFLNGVLGPMGGALELHLFEEGGLTRDRLLYASGRESVTSGAEATRVADKPLPIFERVTEMEMGGQRFRLGWKRGPSYVGGERSQLAWVAVSFTGATLLLAGLVMNLQSSGQRARELVEERTRELSATQGRLRGVLDGTAFSVISTTPEGVIEVFNAGAERMLGYSAAEMIGRQTPAILHLGEEVRARATELSLLLGRSIEPGFEAFVALSRLGTTDEREWSYVRKDGSQLPVWLSVTALRDGAGAVIGFLGIAQDITLRKQLEVAKEAEFSRLAKLAAQVPGMIYQFRLRPDGSSAFPYASEGIREIYRLAPEAVREDAGKVFAVTHPADAAMLAESIQRSARTLQPWICEYRTRHADGTERWLLGHSVPERESDGSVLWHGFIKDITARKEADVVLQLTRIRLEKTFAAISEGLVLQDARGEILECNAAAGRILGLTRDQLEGRTSLDPKWHCVRGDGSPFPGKDHPAMVTLQTGRAQRDVVMGVHKADGSLTWIEINTERIGEHGDPERRVVCSFRDVTARRAVEEKLAQSRSLLTTVTGILPGLVAYWTADLRCSFANSEYRDWFGKTADEMHGIRMEALMGPELFKLNEPYFRGVLEGKAQRFERRLKNADGRDCQTWAQYIPDFAPDQVTVKGFVVLISDITETKRQEEVLRATAAELARQKFALDQHAIVAVTDIEGRITYANDRFCQISQYSREELVGQNHRLINSGHHPKAFFADLYAAVRRGDVWHGEICNRAKDGTLYWEDSTIVPFSDAAGKPTSYIAIRTDITARKQLAASLEQARDQALEASRLKSEFLATMSHEIRTPMNAVIGMAGLLVDTPLNPEQDEMARTLVNGAENLMTIINDILDFSRIEAGRMRLDPAEFDFRRVVEDTVALLAGRAHAKNVELTCEFQSMPLTLLVGDGGRVRQVLTNLIGNAIKFTDAGQVDVIVSTVVHTARRVRLRIAVRDTGVGIPSVAQPRLFQPFTQADGSTTRRFGGTGLGLAISRQLTELMGGEIGFESESGKGSLFWFELELAHGAAAVPVPVVTVRPGRRVLVVDDNATSRRILLGQLAHWHVAAEAVSGGTAALTRLREASSPVFDLVLLDWSMPEMDGVELAEAIRADPALAPLRLVMLSSAAPNTDEERVARLGLATMLTKPATVAQLGRCLAREFETPRAPSSPVAVRGGQPERAGGFRVLLAEDNPANQRVATLLLSKMGCSVVLADNGAQALALLGGQTFDVVLMDCQMPVLDGYETTRRVRSGDLAGVDARLPIIALTAYARPEDRARCIDAGMDDYVTKPIRVADLRAALERCGLLRLAEGEVPVVASREDAGAVIDEEVLATTRSLPGMDGPSLLPELVRLFLSDEGERLDRMGQLLEAQQAGQLADEAHSFGGNAASFGAIHVRRVALDLERMARAENWNSMAMQLGRLRLACERLREEVGQRRLNET